MATGKWMSVKEYADMMGLSHATVRRRCRAGTLPAESEGKDWRIYYEPHADIQLVSQAVQETVQLSMDACIEMLDSTIAHLESMKTGAEKIKEKLLV